MAQFSRANPSPRYRQLTELYMRMHLQGEQMFAGNSLLPHVPRIKRLIDATGAKTILDYGAGKGLQYRPQKIVVDGRQVADGIAEYWDVDEVRCYDPGYAPHNRLPEEQFDGVVCTDVLEHCPEEDLPWILEEIFGYARSFVYLNVACFPARKTLPNGENAHATVRPAQWWRELISANAAGRRGVLWELHAAESAAGDPHLTSIDIEGRAARFRTPNEMTRWRAQTLYTKEPVTIGWLRSMPAQAVLLDVGANVGMYSIFAALAREARVYAFEPESQNYAILNENIQLNGLADRVVAWCAGLSDRTGIDRLYLSGALAGGSCHALGAEVGFDLKPRRAAFVQGAVGLRFDELVQAGQVPPPDYVKVDVDGFEHKVVRGMAETLRNQRVRSLLVELNPALPEHLEMREFLVALGFRWDPAQVAGSARSEGAFAGVAEHVFRR
jgi:FkbM family methyltransferase